MVDKIHIQDNALLSIWQVENLWKSGEINENKPVDDALTRIGFANFSYAWDAAGSLAFSFAVLALRKAGSIHPCGVR